MLEDDWMVATFGSTKWMKIDAFRERAFHHKT
jgi:hypothetical protein